MAMRSATDRVCLLAIEASYGVAPAMTASNAILLMNSQVQPAADKLTRQVDRPFFGGNPFVLVGKRITLTGDCDLIGAAVAGAAAPLGPLYRICAHSETLDAGPPAEAVYAPISKNFASGAIDFYWAGIRFRLLGARGSIDFDFSIKNYAKGSVNITGLLVMPQDGEAPTPIDWSTFQTPLPIESETWEVTVGGVNVCAQQLTLQGAGTVNAIECSEGREVVISNRTPTGTLRVFKDATLATWNPWAIADAHSIVTLQNTIAGTAGKNLSMPIRAQLEYPRPVDIEGMAGFEIPFEAIPSGTGGDEYSLIYT